MPFAVNLRDAPMRRYVLLSLGLVIAFVLVTLAAWANDDNFGAIVQSLLIGGAGKGATSTRKRTEAEDPAKADELVQSLLDQRKEDQKEG